MKKITYLLVLCASTSSFANITLNCKSVFGNSVYTSFILETQIDDKYGMPYDLEDIVGTTVILTGEPNMNHDDVLPGEDWSYVTLGPRESIIKTGSEFSIETCKHCDFNGATYEYKNSGDDEIFFTELYGSDGSAEFSLYSCKK